MADSATPDFVDPEDSDKGSAEIERVRTQFDPNDLRSIASFDDAKRLLESQNIIIHDASKEIGDGFEMLEDKDMLVNVPVIVLAWFWAPGEFGQEFLIMRLVTSDGRRYVITDGSTGLAAQMREYEDRTGITGGLLVERGLRKSEYFLDGEGKVTRDAEMAVGKGATHYLNV